MGMWYPPPPDDQWLAAAAAADTSWQHKLQMLRKKHDLNAGLERPFGMPPLFFNSPPFLPFDALSLDKAGAFNPYSYDEKLPFLQDLVRKFAEQRVEMEREIETDSKAGSDVSPDQKKIQNEHSSPKPLKIPSFKRSASEDEDSTPGNDLYGATVRDSIKEMIGKSNDSPSNFPASLAAASSAFFSPFSAAALPFAAGFPPGLEGFVAPPLDASLSPLPTACTAKKPRVLEKTKSFEASENKSKDTKDKHGSNSSPSSSSSSSPKKTRPKRGQYRRYNHELLMEAVKAVQRGEMSVHRAGSYYGVPHSTLEYKVKERHLLRHKKTGSSGSSSTTSNGISNASNDTPPKKKPDALSAENLSSPSTTNDSNTDETSNMAEEETTSKPQSPNPHPPKPPKPNGLKLTPFIMIKNDPDKPDTKSNTKNKPMSPPPAPSTFPTSPSSSPALPENYLGMLPPFPPPFFPPFLPSGAADPGLAAAAAAYSNAFSSVSDMSASDLLKKLQQKVEGGTDAGTITLDGEESMEPGEVIVKLLS